MNSQEEVKENSKSSSNVRSTLVEEINSAHRQKLNTGRNHHGIAGEGAPHFARTKAFPKFVQLGSVAIVLYAVFWADYPIPENTKDGEHCFKPIRRFVRRQRDRFFGIADEY